MFSAALRCGLIEARTPIECKIFAWTFSAALRCGLIEAPPVSDYPAAGEGFPQHYAAASLKHGRPGTAIKQFEGVFRSITLRPH